ncbi:ABC transporter substrate-binding protein [Weissella halotolerans]|uniref:Oligopeptide transporter protein A n=1 Tax=Weissella halotolerans DSM 20190 TaxID=1123500 RepID=A0A0R2FVV8_9LACO|nr:ABC transporter substrate-binding protein [Weissella halotolerans]KRN32360.1 oligopeptide transporter protein A [Weissella halotolerans DSM 20190]
MSKGKWIAGLAAVAVLGGGGYYAYHQAQTKGNETGGKVGKLDIAYQNDKSLVKGQNLKMAYATETPFKPQWDMQLSDDAIMAKMSHPSLPNAAESLFNVDNEFKIEDGGPAEICFDKEAKTATVTLRDDLKWSDGHSVTAKDYEFEYEIVANPAYGSSRWSSSSENLVGMKEYHEGKADRISGISFPDGENGKTIKLQFKEMKPGFNTSGNGYYLESVAPYHYLKDIKPEKLASDERTTTKPLVIGPYKPAKVVAGESIYYVPNKYYFGEKPKLKSITYTTVAPTKVAAAAKAGKYDVVTDSPNSTFKQIKQLDNVKITGQQDLYISLMYFNLGEYDKQKSENIQNRKTPLQDVRVRKALGYARNVDQVNKKFSNGLSQRATTLIPTVFKDYHDDSLKGYPEDLDKANQLLDDAGYKWDKDKKFRLKDGKRLSFTYLARSGGPNSEAVAQNYIQQWKKIGVDVHLYKDRLADFNSWLEITDSPKGDWDITDGAWSLSSDPSQMDLFSKAAPYNLGHFTSPELTAKLKAVDSPKADTPKKRAQAFKDYQAYMQKQAYVIPTSYNISYAPVNKRVANWSMAYGDDDLWAKIGVTAKQPVK